MTSATMDRTASGRLLDLPACLNSHTGFCEIVKALLRGEQASLDGAWGSSYALVAAALVDHAPGPIVVVTPTAEESDDLADDLELFTSERCLHFPAWETAASDRIVHDDIFGDRLRVLKQLVHAAEPSPDGGRASRILTAPVQSLLQPVPRKATLLENSRNFSVGEALDVDDTLRWLAEHGFHSTTAVELPGEFSSRGGIIDVFAPDWGQPVRIELFGDEIESLRQFDVASQRSLQSLAGIEVTVMNQAAEEDAHLIDYLPANTWFLLANSEELAAVGRQYMERSRDTEWLHSVEESFRRIEDFSSLLASPLAASSGHDVVHLPVESVERFSGEIDKVRDELDRLGDGSEVFVVTHTEAEIERLGELLRTTRLASRGALHFALGSLSNGFRLVDHKIILIAARELFRRGELRRTPKRRLGKAIDSFLDLQEGDLVVHLSHGIGRYRGLSLLDKDGHVEEHLLIEFAGGTKIYVPATRIELVQKYVGGTKTRPTLAKIGGKAWTRQKQAAETAVADLAIEMLDIQAERQSRQGICFEVSSEWQREFDASFPYEETPDQSLGLQAIAADMGNLRPMDRLICGDVGYGKTELAMRAAFKAVDSGYQVAVLVPTTILAEQHYKNFRDRMAEFPVDVAKLSRFCSPQEQRETVKKLAGGTVDIVIGTHRLASKDVQFCNLGLVVIDEEQRFGVEVKERLKSFRSMVDVLTMSATPIPRTLHMSLVGVRDISNLETPPEDRVAIETRVTRWNEELIRNAVLRELNRGGQIYFVHNRVNDIHVVEEKLKRIVPEASVQIGHGQMPESQLEQVMTDFIAHRFDLLLATTIVESGLDIPNANTIFIDEADRYGLADLHQLRGRVGRYKHRAYCYMLIDPGKHLSPNAARRLRAIEEFSDMGAGFAIAMRDLEIRGAGNLLGTQQSGHIAAVGYELYCQLLEAAVRRQKQLPPKLSTHVDIDLPFEAHLPQDYVPDMRMKIDLYRRMSRVERFDHLEELKAELVDRFGQLPDPVLQLLSLAALKMEAAMWQITAIGVEDKFLVFSYSNRNRMEQLARANQGRLRVVDKKAYLPIPPLATNPEKLLELVKSVLRST